MIREALARLGIRRLVLAIHDQSFPSTPDEDVGRGSPYGKGARALLAFVRAEGFDGVQLGPQGDTALDNPSPYDGALFTRSPLSMALATLCEDDDDWATISAGLLAPAVAGRPDGPPDRVSYRYAWSATQQLLRAMHVRFAATRDRQTALAVRFSEFERVHRHALEPDGMFEALVALHGTDDWRRWSRPDAQLVDGDRGRAAGAVTATARDLDVNLYCPSPSPSPADAAARRRARLRIDRASHLERHAFGQFLLGEQHARLRRSLAAAAATSGAAASAGAPPLCLYGDLPIGFSHRDVWSRRALFRADYLMGAPPSRTNPDGQAWGFPVLDPDQVHAGGDPLTPGPVLELVAERVDRLLSDFDGLRIDHPHGLVCPWVYAADAPDPGAAVGRGARLFCSPNVREHPALARFAIPSPEQLSADPGIARYADDWVRSLTDAQVATYGVLFDAIMTRVAAAGRQVEDVVCEVLSTWPYPLRRVMERYRLGRFCVLQKADLARPEDVYRAENASERDWIMVGNHDTPPVWALAEAWHGTAPGARWGEYLAERLMPSSASRASRGRLARWIAADARHLCHAMFAATFASRARQVSIFFADFFGARESYNRPGTVRPDNWTLRLPSDWHARHQHRLESLDALNLPLAVALALASRADSEGGGAPAAQHDRARVTDLLREARERTPLLDDEIVALILGAFRPAS